MKGIMIQGTSSDVGKSYVTTALCRILANKGYKVAPYKSQNMSNNSYVTYDGKEIGRAQGVQAEAAKAEPNVYMNPILLKPMADTKSEVVLLGEVFRPFDGRGYREKFAMEKGIEVIKESLNYIEENYDAIVIEGAGSPAEINLNDREIVNMRVANLADVDVLLVVDIDRGGSFASVVGTLELLGEDRNRIKGIIFNKFRGDISLLQDGLDWLEEYTDIKVVGVVPYIKDVYVEVEDAQSDALLHSYSVDDPLDIAVIHMERISNNTDVEAFIHEEDVKLRIVKDAKRFGKPDAIIIPGTKSTIADLEYLVESGLYDEIKKYNENGGIIFGICGGYQVLGNKLIDPVGVDNVKDKAVNGLGILPVETTFNVKKQVRRMVGITLEDNLKVEGYEIHLGNSERQENVLGFAVLDDKTIDGCVIDKGRVIGTYLHNIFHNDVYRNNWLNYVRRKKGLQSREVVDTSKIKEESYEKLAKIVEDSLDIDYIIDIMENK